MSVPIPESNFSVPTDMPSHPAFHAGLRQTKRPTFMPLNEIGMQRRTPSMDSQQATVISNMGSIDQTIHEGDEHVVVVPEQPLIIPELQHLSAIPPPPPPPPPPPHAPFANSHHSLSSGSGVGTINIVMDDTSPGGTPVIDVFDNNSSSSTNSNHNNNKALPQQPQQPQQQRQQQQQQQQISFQLQQRVASPPTNEIRESRHSRSKSIDNFGTKFKGFTDRMRSSSRGRNNNPTRSPRPADKPSPYESIPQYF
jgi:hypothetical protein